MHSEWLGQKSYSEVQSWQKSQVQKISGKSDIEIWGLEFQPVVTLGLRSKKEFDLNWSEEKLQAHKIALLKTDRGGRATLHSPGQMVIFPMLDIQKHQIKVTKFVELLFQVTSQFLLQNGIKNSWQTEDAGVYTDKGKIAFCGIRLENGVVRHGISINISNDLGLFESLVPCGIAKRPLDRMIDHLDPVSSGQACTSQGMERLFKDWIQCFQEQWNQKGFFLNPTSETAIS